MNRLFCLLSTLCLVSSNAVPQNRTEKAFPIFSIVKFANDECLASGTRNTASERLGTCYTAEECTDRKGTAGNSCAEGFGICCEFTLNGPTNRGKTVAENHVRINDDSTTAGSVEYTICPCGSDICRIRFNFNTLVLSEKQLGTAAAGTAAGLAIAQGQAGMSNSIGSCETDTFMISGATAGSGSPVICGTNTGHHMILDSDGTGCHTITLMMGAGGISPRQWDIDVRQFRCSAGPETLAGPPGCLQYFTTQNGRVSDYGYAALPAAPGATPQLGATTTHLARQDYKICFRRFPAQCRICFAPFAPTGGVGTDTIADQAGFGVGNQAMADRSATMAFQAIDANCDTDFITIPGAQAAAQNGADGVVARLCGRRLNNNPIAAAASITICTRQTPFMIGVNFGEGEEFDAAATMNDQLESFVPPSGHVGFRLAFAQDAVGCP